MFSVYVLLSLTNGCYYIGSTGDLPGRLVQHNSGGQQVDQIRSTVEGRPSRKI
ncbi:MAG: hypothetical protein FI707_02945 [SAR202 cluster bacterium]|nr:hypothetical protein [SAR202 cluster bacterium]MQG67730.1 hypothetical protein [SAR202 cluster bacterium]